MPVVVFLIDKVANMKLRDTIIPEMGGKWVNRIHEDTFLPVNVLFSY